VVRPRPAAILSAFEKHQQLRHRYAPSFIRHVLAAFGQQTLSTAQAAERLGLSLSRLCAAPCQIKTPAPFHQSPPMTVSCFANYTEFLF
jgi:hypothetical protein